LNERIDELKYVPKQARYTHRRPVPREINLHSAIDGPWERGKLESDDSKAQMMKAERETDEASNEKNAQESRSIKRGFGIRLGIMFGVFKVYNCTRLVHQSPVRYHIRRESVRGKKVLAAKPPSNKSTHKLNKK
jgi:hypothetical protein